MSSHVKAAAPRVKGTVAFKAQNTQRVGSSSQTKRQRPAPPSDDEDEDEDEGSEDEADVESEADTDDEIAAAQNGKSKKTASECHPLLSFQESGCLTFAFLQNGREGLHRQAHLELRWKNY
jgi:hypothetical protein